VWHSALILSIAFAHDQDDSEGSGSRSGPEGFINIEFQALHGSLMPKNEPLDFGYTSGVLSPALKHELCKHIRELSSPSQNLHDSNSAPAVGGGTFRGFRSVKEYPSW